MPENRDPRPIRRWLNLPAATTAPWAGAVEGNALNVLLNFSGEGVIFQGNEVRLTVPQKTALWVRLPASPAVQASRLSGSVPHECLSLVFPDAWLDTRLASMVHQIREDLHPLLVPPYAAAGSLMLPLTREDDSWARTRVPAHLCEAARSLMEAARLTEFLLDRIFAPPAPHGESRAARLARERVEKVKAAVLARMDDPPPLEDLARIAGCAPHYLSRTFTEVEGRTFTLWLRSIRIARAADLIASGRCNVSEAAIEVGYRSFSHFSRAFFEEKGVVPSRWVLHVNGQQG